MRKVLFGLAIGLAVAIPTVSHGHGPTRQKVTEEVPITAPPAVVWERIKDFNGLAGWHSAVASSTVTDGNKVDSVRTLTLKNGGTVIEKIEGYDEQAMSYRYRMVKGDLPVTNYTSAISVKAGTDGGSIVEWKGAFYRGYPNNNPPPELSDEAAVKAITEVYTAGLANLKRIIEGKSQ